MSTNKKFRVQNGIDITGEVTVGGVTVINADGTVVSDVSDQLVPLQADVAALETSVENIIGTSPETLDTLQEIVAAYEGADADLQLLVAQTNQDVADLQNSVGSGEGLTTPYVSTEITYDENVGSQQYYAAARNDGKIVVWDSSDEANYKLIEPDHGSNNTYGFLTISRDWIVASKMGSDRLAFWSVASVMTGNTSQSGDFRFNSAFTNSIGGAINGNTAYVQWPAGTEGGNARFAICNLLDQSVGIHSLGGGYNSEIKAMETVGTQTFVVSQDSNSPNHIRVRVYEADGSLASHVLSGDNSGFVPDGNESDGYQSLAVSSTVLALRHANRDYVRVWNPSNFSNVAVDVNPSDTIRAIVATDDYLIMGHDDKFAVYSTTNLGGNPTVISTPTYVPNDTHVVNLAVSGRKLFVGYQTADALVTYDLDDLSADPVIISNSMDGIGKKVDASDSLNMTVTRTENIIPNSGVVPAINYLEDKTNDMQTEISTMQTEIDTLSGADTSLTQSIASNTTAISNEVTRATAAEQSNTDAIAAVQSQVNNILSNTDSASLDSLSEIVAAFQAADSTLTGAVAANSAAHAQNASDISATNARTSGISTSSGSSNIQMTAEVDMDSNKVTNMADPTAAQDATTKAYVDAADASLQAQIDAGSFDGSAIDQNLVPAVTDTYSLGTPDMVWKDLYIGPGSLYLNGTKILEDNSGTITMYADAGQNLSFGATGGGSIDLNAGDESIQIKSDLVLSVGETISTVGGAATRFGGSVNMQTHKIENVGAPTADLDVATKLYVDTLIAAGVVSGDRTFDANVVVEGNLTVSGTTTTVNSETISLADNIIDLNSNLTSGAPTEHAGIRVLRGDESAVQVRWNETEDHWEVYNGSAWTKIALDTDDLAEGSTNLYFTEARARGCVSADDHSCIDYDETTGKFSLDVAETEAAITPDSAKDADKLDGQHGSYYRINVYDANGTLVN